MNRRPAPLSTAPASPPSAVSTTPSSAVSSAPRFRSAAVARMAAMPVATLRIWEQRYRAVQPATAPSGHRLYSAADVQRVLLLRQLTGQGHAIGSIAGLDSAQLDELAQARMPLGRTATVAAPAPAGTDGGVRARSPAAGPRSRGTVRLAVVGPALALRLQRPAAGRQPTGAHRVVAVFDGLEDAAQAGTGTRADLLLWHATEWHPGAGPALDAARAACGATAAAVVYRYAPTAAVRALQEGGVAVVREPSDDATLLHWLADTLPARPAQAAHAAHAAAPASTAHATEADAPALTTVSTAPPLSPLSSLSSLRPRRYDDAALTAIAGLSPALACECPRHVAELLMQVASFEAYSAGCMNRSADDAALHAYLHQVAATARTLFESALERVARHEGLSLPSPG